MVPDISQDTVWNRHRVNWMRDTERKRATPTTWTFGGSTSCKFVPNRAIWISLRGATFCCAARGARGTSLYRGRYTRTLPRNCTAPRQLSSFVFYNGKLLERESYLCVRAATHNLRVYSSLPCRNSHEYDGTDNPIKPDEAAKLIDVVSRREAIARGEY